MAPCALVLKMAENWFHAAHGSAQGPVGRAHILELIASGEIGPQTLVWRKGLDDWQPAGTHFDFDTPADEALAEDAPTALTEPAPHRAEPPKAPTQDWISRAREAAPAQAPDAPWSAAAAASARAADRVPMDPFTAVRRVYARYFTFSGRAGRGEFWWFSLYYMIATIALSMIDFGLIDSSYAPLSTAFALLNIFPAYAVSTRRLHDCGNSGWWIVAQVTAPIVLMGGALVMFLQQVGAWGTASVADIREGGYLTGILSSLMVYALAGLASLILSIIILVMLGRRGDPLENRYGPPPP